MTWSRTGSPSSSGTARSSWSTSTPVRSGGGEPSQAAIRFRPLQRADFPLLAQWIGAPHVAPWWSEDPSLDAVDRAYGPAVDGADPTEMFVVELDDRPIGFVQRYLVDDYPGWADSLGIGQAAGIDYLIGAAEQTGSGVGTRLVDTFTAHTMARYPGAACVVVTVAQANRRSWRALEKAGYERVFAGSIDSDDPSDDGPQYVYVRRR